LLSERVGVAGRVVLNYSVRGFRYGLSDCLVCDDEFALGRQAAAAVAAVARRLLAERDEIRMIFAAGESQITFLDALALDKPTVELPASILRTTPGTIFMDRQSCPARGL
jgi:hypothetical protein